MNKLPAALGWLGLALILLIGLHFIMRPQSAQDAYRDKVASCRMFAIEGRNELVDLCRSELPGLMREAQAESRDR